MKTTLIIFAVLLFLLTLLAAFGGSIRYSEPFYDTVKSEHQSELLGHQPESTQFYTIPQEMGHPETYMDAASAVQQRERYEDNMEVLNQAQEIINTEDPGLIEPFEEDELESKPASY